MIEVSKDQADLRFNRDQMNHPPPQSPQAHPYISISYPVLVPNKIKEVELESEDLHRMIRQPPKVRAIRFHHEPESTDTSHAHYITRHHFSSRGAYPLEGARWHLLTKVFSKPESLKADLHPELLL